MTIQEYLTLKDPLANADVQKAIAEVLWPGPWEHERSLLGPAPPGPDHLWRCKRCEAKWVCRIQDPVPDCLVPPPITDAVEVVARKLRDKCDYSPELIAAVAKLSPHHHEVVDVVWFAFKATPAQQIGCGLAALGKLEEKP